MVQIIMLVLGVYYLYKLINLSSAGLNLGLPPEAVFQWRAARRMQYIWGIAAGWGSLVLGLAALFMITLTTRQCFGADLGLGDICWSDTNTAFLAMLGVTAVVLVGGIALSVMAGNRAKAIEARGVPSFAYGVPAGQPAWGQPPAQPGWGQPPAQVWGQPPAPQGWGQPPAQPNWGQPPVQGWGQPPAQPGPTAPGWSQPPAAEPTGSSAEPKPPEAP
jgi:hypothetical protein